MKIIKNLLSLYLILLVFFLNIYDQAHGLGNVDWVLLKENNDGKEWLDRGSIKQLPNNKISVLTKFFKNENNSNKEGELSLYVMTIDCNNKKFKDNSINGIPQFNAKWQTTNNDELIEIVIEKSCTEFMNR